MSRAACCFLVGAIAWLGVCARVSAEVPSNVVADTTFLSITVIEHQMHERANRRIPASLRKSAGCVAVFPSVVKAGFIIAAEHGNGLVACRHQDGEWGSPAVFNLNAGSIGIQAGIQSASYLLLFLDPEAVSGLLEQELTFAGEVSIAAGPVGATSSSEQPAVVSYVRTAGLFAGVNLAGVVLKFAPDANRDIYGILMEPYKILFEVDEIPLLFQPFHTALSKFAP